MTIQNWIIKKWKKSYSKWGEKPAIFSILFIFLKNGELKLKFHLFQQACLEPHKVWGNVILLTTPGCVGEQSVIHLNKGVFMFHWTKELPNFLPGWEVFHTCENVRGKWWNVTEGIVARNNRGYACLCCLCCSSPLLLYSVSLQEANGSWRGCH